MMARRNKTHMRPISLWFLPGENARGVVVIAGDTTSGFASTPFLIGEATRRCTSSLEMLRCHHWKVPPCDTPATSPAAVGTEAPRGPSSALRRHPAGTALSGRSARPSPRRDRPGAEREAEPRRGPPAPTARRCRPRPPAPRSTRSAAVPHSPRGRHPA